MIQGMGMSRESHSKVSSNNKYEERVLNNRLIMCSVQ